MYVYVYFLTNIYIIFGSKCFYSVLIYLLSINGCILFSILLLGGTKFSYNKTTS